MSAKSEAEKQAMLDAARGASTEPGDPSGVLNPPDAGTPEDFPQAVDEPVGIPTPIGGFAPEEPVNTQRIGPDMEAAPELGKPGRVAHIPSNVPQGDETREWGPYETYEIINTGFGEYAVEVGYVLFFEPQDIFNRKAGQFVRVNTPRHRLIAETQAEALARIHAELARQPVRA